MMSSLSRWLRSPRTVQNRARRTLLCVEQLEGRVVPTAVAAPSGLISWWAGDGDATDRVGANAGTLNNGVTFAQGEVASAFQFNTSNYVSATTSGLPTGNSARTLEMWIKASSFHTSGEAYFAGYGNFGSSNETYHLGTTGSNLFWSQWGTGIGGPSLSANRWYHVAVTNVGNSATLYLDGVAVGSNTVTINTPAGTSFYVGRIPGALGDSRKLDGMVDEVSVYNRALSAAEIQAIYQAGSDGKVLGPIAVDFPSVLEGSTGTTTPVTFTISRTGSLSGPLTVDWTTADGTATVAGSDYVAASGQFTFADGEATKYVAVTVKGDNTVEPNEVFQLILTPAGGTPIMVLATILNDDVPISISDATAIEGDHAAHYRGAFVDDGYLNHYNPITFGPDGKLYTAVGTGPGFNSIRRYDGTTGEFLDTFVPQGRIKGVRDIVFRDGYLYVGSEATDEVLRFNATDGAFLNAFVTAGSGGIDGPHGLTFGPDANGDNIPELYVSGRNSFNVVRYDGATGQPLGTYVTPASGGLSWPEALTFDPSGAYLLVASTGTSQILKYDAQTGAYVGIGASTGLSGPKDVKFGPDGLMYVTSGGNDRILRFTAGGTYVDDYVPAGSGGMDNPSRLAFGPDGNLYVTAVGNSQILRFGTESEAVFTVSLSTASTLPLTVDFATLNGSAIAGSDYTSTSGTLTFSPGVTSKTIRVPTLDGTIGEPTETFTVNLSIPVGGGGVITDGQGVGTILDNETKFFVVNDATANETYEYGSGGVAVETYALNSGNTAPRGAATTAAGTKVWVVDANKNVYVYDSSGGFLGSWTAGSLAANATVEGIATNGTDIWIVDNKQDKVFKYTGAATRLSGSQNAASSFNLNSGNKDAKDIVTDGASLWVVNDSSTDKVFKYTLAGALVGSWTIGAVNSQPTGITIDPSSVNHIWIVDAGTDRVYQYDNAATRTSGSQNPSTSFALAAGNTNPQGIADPPTGSPSAIDIVFSQQPALSDDKPVTLVKTKRGAVHTVKNKSELAASHHRANHPAALVHSVFADDEWIQTLLSPLQRR